MRRYVIDHTSEELRDLLQMLLGALVAFWVLSWLLGFVPGVRTVYVLAAFGFLFSVQAAYYRRRLSLDPAYTIPRCKCGGRRRDDTEAVLRSRESALLGIPNAVFGIALYAALPVLVHFGHAGIAALAAGLAVVASAYLGYVMVVRIASICPNCVNVAALNLLLLVQLLRS